jgi:uncharacterized protein (DUF433 family)
MGAKSYVEHGDGGYWVAGTRVSLDSLVYAFREGQTAESIAQSFPVLTLEQVYGTIAYYLAHRESIDTYLRQQEAKTAPENLSLTRRFQVLSTCCRDFNRDSMANKGAGGLRISTARA